MKTASTGAGGQPANPAAVAASEGLNLSSIISFCIFLTCFKLNLILDGYLMYCCIDFQLRRRISTVSYGKRAPVLWWICRRLGPTWYTSLKVTVSRFNGYLQSLSSLLSLSNIGRNVRSPCMVLVLVLVCMCRLLISSVTDANVHGYGSIRPCSVGA